MYFFQQVSSGLGDAFTTGGRRKYDTEYMRGVFFMIINSCDEQVMLMAV